MRRYLTLAVIAAAALIWPQPLGLAQTPTGLASLPAATVFHDTDTLPLCQNGAPSCSIASYVWSNATLGQIAGYFTQRGLPTASKTSNYTILSTDTGTCFNNAGATGTVVLTLPTLAAGLNFCFTVMAAFRFEIDAPASSGVHIAIAPNNSGANGHIDDNTLYETITIYVPAGSATQWVTASVVGSNWQIDN